MEVSKGTHNPWYFVLVIYNVFTLVAVFVFSGLSTSDNNGGLFVSTQKDQARKFILDISPAEWIFNIWFVIYAWQLVWLIYAVVNLFRKTPFQHPLYTSPYLLPPAMLGFYVVANGCNVAWCFLFDRGYIIFSLAALVVMSVLLMTAMGFSYKGLDEGWVDLVRQGREFEAWLVRGLVHNGLAIYASWVCVATVLNLAMVPSYETGSDVSVVTSSTIALGVLALEMGIFVLVDVCLMDRYSRYTLMPYVVLVVGLVAVVQNNWHPGQRNWLFSLVLCGLAGGFLLLKALLTLIRHVRERGGGAQD